VGECPGEPPAAGGEVGTELEEQGKGSDQAEEGLVGRGGLAPVGCGAEIVPLPLEPVEPSQAIRLDQLRLRPLRQGQKVVPMPFLDPVRLP
jgi:hypothetical protein